MIARLGAVSTTRSSFRTMIFSHTHLPSSRGRAHGIWDLGEGGGVEGHVSSAPDPGVSPLMTSLAPPAGGMAYEGTLTLLDRVSGQISGCSHASTCIPNLGIGNILS